MIVYSERCPNPLLTKLMAPDSNSPSQNPSQKTGQAIQAQAKALLVCLEPAQPEGTG